MFFQLLSKGLTVQAFVYNGAEFLQESGPKGRRHFARIEDKPGVITGNVRHADLVIFVADKCDAFFLGMQAPNAEFIGRLPNGNGQAFELWGQRNALALYIVTAAAAIYAFWRVDREDGRPDHF